MVGEETWLAESLDDCALRVVSADGGGVVAKREVEEVAVWWVRRGLLTSDLSEVVVGVRRGSAVIGGAQ